VPRPDRRRLALLALAGSLLVLSPAAAEEKPQEKLKAVEQQLDQGRTRENELEKTADALADELANLRTDSVQAAEEAQVHEAAVSELETQLKGLSADEAAKTKALALGRAHEADLLAALARLARNPPEALALGPLAPEDAIRSGLLLGATVPQLQARAQALSRELAELRRLRAEIGGKRQALEVERRGLAKQRARIDTLIQRKTALREQALRSAEETRRHLEQLSAQASDLHELIDRLEAERKAREENERKEAERREAEQKARIAALPRAEGPGHGEEVRAPSPVELDPSKPKTIRSFAKARGAMVYPVSGALTIRYGELNEFGVSNKGLTLETRPGAVVVAPFDGRIEFAGPFKGYGQILIIRHGDGYHSLLAGLDRIDGTVGDWLVAGEPVGAMASGEPKPRLYLELRHDGQPINPLPWLATREQKVSG
jgi:septal ring factor EnvC (AmiA/AmiB activator)